MRAIYLLAVQVCIVVMRQLMPVRPKTPDPQLLFGFSHYSQLAAILRPNFSLR